MTPDLSRRRFFGVAVSLLAAPAIVRFESIMPVRAPKLILPWFAKMITLRWDHSTLMLQHLDPSCGEWRDIDIRRTSWENSDVA